MVVDLDAHSALDAVEAPWWSQDLAGVAEAELVMLLLLVDDCLLVFSHLLHMQVLELVWTEVFLNSVSDAFITHCRPQVLLGLIFHKVLGLRIRLSRASRNEATVHVQRRQYAWIREHQPEKAHKTHR